MLQLFRKERLQVAYILRCIFHHLLRERSTFPIEKVLLHFLPHQRFSVVLYTQVECEKFVETCIVGFIVVALCLLAEQSMRDLGVEHVLRLHRVLVDECGRVFAEVVENLDDGVILHNVLEAERERINCVQVEQVDHAFETELDE